MLPASTGAALATIKALPGLAGRFDGVAVRVPIPVGSIADVVAVTARPVTRDEVNDAFREEAASDRYRGILGVAEDPLVSSDLIGDPRASVVDAAMTKVVDGTLVKVMSWYDNEWGFTCQMIREAFAPLGYRRPSSARSAREGQGDHHDPGRRGTGDKPVPVAGRHRSGDDGLRPVVEIMTIITVIGYSWAAVIALDVARRLENDGVSAEVIDLRSLRPLDRQTVCASVRKTSRAVIVEDDWLSYGIGAEIAATIAEGAGVTPTVAARSAR